jgi:hypothetical protein
LLANIFEHAWSQGKNLSLSELILQVQSPPFTKLGVFDINTFFPDKDRFELAMRLNNILAAPSFQSWIEGEPLEIQNLLYTPEGKPRHSIFYIAHLSDAERMFFVTLLFTAVESWMRTQSGTPSLRALIYFDEIFGYLPPTQNPASKPPILRMLKQARAFGVGLLLATQNPVDVDYKALSNAGTWFIGKLQTDQDKQRLLDGLQGAAPGIDRATYDRLLSTLGKRVFLMHNVHEKKPVLFQTRWAMNYLAGPLTRAQIPALNMLAQSAEKVSEPGMADEMLAGTSGEAPTAQVGESLPGTTTRPKVPARIEEYFLPNTISLAQAYKETGQSMPGDILSQALLYRPFLLGQVQARFLERRYNLDTTQVTTVLVQEPDRRGYIHWEQHEYGQINPATLEKAPDPRGRFLPLEAPLNDAALLANLKKDLEDWVYRNQEARVLANPTLKVYAGPEISQAEFRRMCSEAAQALRDAEIAKTKAAYDKKLDAIEAKLRREERELQADEAEYNQRKMEEVGTHFENVISLFNRRRRTLTTSLTKRRLTEKAKAEVEESIQAIEAYEKEIEALQAEMEGVLQDIQERWENTVAEVEEINVPAKKTQIFTELFGVVWLPYYIVQSGSGAVELAAYK